MGYMLSLIPLLLSGCASLASAVESWGIPDLLHQRDKQEHFAGGAIIGAATVAALSKSPLKPWQRVLAGVAASAVVGVAKEVADHRHPHTHDCDPKDAIATVAGGVVGGFSIEWTLRF